MIRPLGFVQALWFILLILATCWSSVASAYSLDETHPKQRATELNDEGVQLFSAGKFTLALQKFQEALALHPSAKAIRTNLGKTYAAIAIGTLEEAHNRGRAGDKEHRSALESLEKALLHWPGDADTYHAVALCHLRLRQLDPAARALRQAVSKDKKSFRSWRLLGIVEDQRGDSAKALAAVEQALVLRPSDAVLKRRARRIKFDLEAVESYRERKSARFKILSPPALPAAVTDELSRVLEKVCDEVQRRWSLPAPSTVTVICYPPGEFSERTGLHEGVGGAFDGRIRIAFPAELTEGGLDLEQVARHEAIHLYLNRLPERPPRWLDEGIAQLLDGDPRAEYRERFIQAVRAKPHIGVQQREAAFRHEDPQTWGPLYLHGFFFVKHLVDTRGAFRLDMVVRRVAGGSSWADAFELVHGEAVEAIDRAWRRSLLEPKPKSR